MGYSTPIDSLDTADQQEIAKVVDSILALEFFTSSNAFYSFLAGIKKQHSALTVARSLMKESEQCVVLHIHKY